MKRWPGICVCIKVKRMNKYDTHVHTSEVSDCGQLTAAETIRLYKEKQYDGVVITDHYTEGFFHDKKALPWKEQVNAYLKGYYAALACGKALGVTVLPGMELRLKGSPNEYLLLGMDPDLYICLPEMYMYTLEQLREVTKKYGIALYQAHPFRPVMKAAPPKMLDGCEVYNGNPRHFSNNEKADQYATENSLLKLSGSDCHMAEDVARGGVVTRKRIATAKELAEEIAAGRVKLIKDGRVMP